MSEYLKGGKQINLGRDLPPSSLISLKIPHPLPSLLDQRVSRQTGKIVPVHIGSLRWKMEGMMGWMLAWPQSVAVVRCVKSVSRLLARTSLFEFLDRIQQSWPLPQLIKFAQSSTGILPSR